MATLEITPVAEALTHAGFRTTAFGHRVVFAPRRLVQLYLASFDGSCRGIPPGQRRLIAQKKA